MSRCAVGHRPQGGTPSLDTPVISGSPEEEFFSLPHRTWPARSQAASSPRVNYCPLGANADGETGLGEDAERVIRPHQSRPPCPWALQRPCFSGPVEGPNRFLP